MYDEKEIDPEDESVDESRNLYMQVKIGFQSASIFINPDGSYEFTGTYSNKHAKVLYDEIFDDVVSNEEIIKGKIKIKVNKNGITISGKNLPKKDKQEAQKAKNLEDILQAVGAEELIEMCQEIDQASKTTDAHEPIGTQIGAMIDMESIKAAIFNERLGNVEHTMDVMTNIKEEEKSKNNKDNTDGPNLDD